MRFANKLHQRSLLGFALALASGASCVDPPIFLNPNQQGGPAGILDGTLTYVGPLPCTEDNHVLGAAVLEVFDIRFLPPPEGLGTTATSLGAIGGDALFSGVRDQLTFNPDGSLWCPDPAAKPVTVSASWTIGPLAGAVYEVRGFYDYDGDFDPILTVFKFPTQGDVAGGAIENATDVLQGKAPIYRRIALGDPQPDGSYKIPELGASVGGVTVTFGLPLPLEPPYFYPKDVFYSTKTCNNGTVVDAPPQAKDPAAVSMPADYTLPVFDALSPADTEDSLVRMVLGAGVAPDEVETASASPFNFHVKDPAPRFTFNWQDVNGDGMFTLTGDHVPDSNIIPSLFPLAIFGKLDDTQGILVAQAAPAVILQGLTIYKDLPTTAFFATDQQSVDTEVIVGVRPAVLCIDPQDFTKHAKLVVTHKTDCGGNPVLTNEELTKVALKKQFGRDIDVVEGCLPQGAYGINLIYNTGQAWTVPNEAGVCQALEPANKENTMCGDPKTAAHRPLVATQRRLLTIGKPVDEAYCVAHPTPAECLPPPPKKAETE